MVATKGFVSGIAEVKLSLNPFLADRDWDMSRL